MRDFYFSNYHKLYTLLKIILIMCSMIFVYFMIGEFYMLEWVLFMFCDYHMSLSFKFDTNISMFAFTVGFIFSSVYMYSLVYMNGEMMMNRFMKLIMLFVVFMMIMIYSSNLFTSLIGWDGLGVTSMILIMFYNSNSALKSGIFTFMINRLGDSFLLILLLLSYCVHPMLLMHEKCFSLFIGVSLVIMSMTKSSQFPFSSWLTKAMEAPTPVSSLVHSSTLVTAGIYMIIMYKELWNWSYGLSMLISVSSLITMMVANLSSLMETDLKKIIAYSTLSQLGFIYFCLSFHMYNQVFFYLIMHAFFKAMMFMVVGFVIYFSSGWQDIRILSLNQNSTPCMMMIFIMSSFSLCGMPFLSGFFSKDLILDSFMELSFSLFFLLVLGLSFSFTCLYCIRIVWYLSTSNKKLICYKLDNTIMIYCMTGLYVFSCMMGSMMSWSMSFMTLGLNFSKVYLIFTLVFMKLVFWKLLKNMNSNFLFIKSSFYLTLVSSYLIILFFSISFSFIWSKDLGLFGKVVSLNNFQYNKKIHNNYFSFKNMLLSFKEILVMGIFLLMI